MSPGSQPGARLRSAAPLLIVAGLFSLPIYLQLHPSFRPIDVRFEEIFADDAVVPFAIDEEHDAFYLEYELLVGGTAAEGESVVTLSVNGEPFHRVDVLRYFADRREKVLLPRSSVVPGGNELGMRLDGAGASEARLRGRLQNHYGISPNFPRAAIVADESFRARLAGTSVLSHCGGLLGVFFAGLLILALADAGAGRLRRRPASDRRGPRHGHFVLPLALPWMSLAYSLATPLHVWFPAATILGLCAILWLLSFSAAFGYRHRVALGQALVVITVTIGLAEVSFRAYDRMRPTFVFYKDSYDRFRGRPGQQFFDTRLNSRGFNDREHAIEKPPGALRVVALGDSFAHGVVPYRHNFLTLLEERARPAHPTLEVINMGIPGADPQDYLALLVDEGLAYGPDLVLVCLFVGNDLAETERSLADRSYLLSFFRFVQTLSQVSRPDLRGEGAIDSVASSYDDAEPSMELARFMEIEIDRSWIYRQDETDALATRASDVAHVLSRMHQLSRAVGAELVVVVLPDEAQVDSRLQEMIVASHRRPAPDFDFTLPNEVLRRHLEERGIPVVDLLPAFADRGERERLYKPQDTHWNIAGNQVAAAAILEGLSPYLPTPR